MAAYDAHLFTVFVVTTPSKDGGNWKSLENSASIYHQA